MAQMAQVQDSLDYHLAGPASVKQRDMEMPQFARTERAPSPQQNYVLWQNAATAGPSKPFVQGSFTSLVDAGKITMDARRTDSQIDDRPSLLPGYTGYIRGQQHISGRTYGEMTRMASETNYREQATTSPIPSAPQQNRKIQHLPLKDRFMYGVTKNQIYHLPGSTLHVPGQRATYGTTYGRSTRDQIRRHDDLHNRPHPQEMQNQAFPMRPRQFYHIESSSLPGPLGNTQPPKKVLPTHIQYLKFYAM